MAPQPSNIRRPGLRRRWSALPVFALLSACGGGGNPSEPSGTTAVITNVSPATGTTLGGTPVVITGANFAVGASVTIGGMPVTNITVVSGNEITARTAEHGAGVADVMVTEGARSGSLPGAFTYLAPTQATNTLPVIQSIVAQGARTNEPAQFADLNEEIDVVATVADTETAPDLLDYRWTADVSTLTGTGHAVKWKAPSSAATPARTPRSNGTRT